MAPGRGQKATGRHSDRAMAITRRAASTSEGWSSGAGPSRRMGGKATDDAGSEPSLLHEFFERQVDRHPDHCAIEFNGTKMSHVELETLANRIANCLRSREVGAGSLVGLCLEKSHALFAAMLGVLKAGAGYVPLDPRFPLARISYVLADAGVHMVLSEGRFGRELERRISPSMILMDRDAEEIAGAASVRCGGRPQAAPDDICYVIYTSGSTGRPKGVIVEHRNAVSFVRTLETTYGLTPSDRVYQGFSAAFDASIEEIWAAFSVGGTLLVPPEDIARSPLDAAEFINAHRATFFSTVPTFLAMVRSDLPSVRLLVVGGEACPPELVSRWAKPPRRMLNTYGPTEATVVATLGECMAGRPVTIGTALPGYKCHVLDGNLQPVSRGDVGELYIGGAGVARGYMNLAALSAERFLADPFPGGTGAPGRLYRTNDLVRQTETGEFEFVGRNDGQVKIRGFRVEPSEIEAVLMEHPAIRAAAVAVIARDGLSEIAAYVVVLDGFDQARQCIATFRHERLPEYMVPKYFEVIADLPTMTSGKVDRAALPPPRAPLVGNDRKVIAASTELERTIVAVWERCLGISPISVMDDFFLDLGGHSLTAAHAVTELRTRLNNLQISMRDLYHQRTARRLAEHLRACATGRPANGGELLQPVATRVSWLMRWTCVALQTLSLTVLYAVFSAPLLFAIMICVRVYNGDMTAVSAVEIFTTVALAVWPSWLLLSIAVKWLAIGRYRQGRYPVWGFYYFRWWLVCRFQDLSWCEIFAGTPLMSLYYQAMGAKVGRNCTIGTPQCVAFDLVAIAEDTSIGADTQLLGYRVEDGWLVLGTVDIGRECFVGMHCALGLDVRIGDRARLEDMSCVADGEELPSDQCRAGSPAGPASVPLPVWSRGAPRNRQALLFGFIHLCLIYAMGYVLIASAIPAAALVGGALYLGGPLWAIGAAFAAAPLTLLWYVVVASAVKRLAIGDVFPGVFPLASGEYLRFWFANYLMNNTRHLLLPVYATVYLPGFLRLMGARIGKGVEISTVMDLIPDLLDVGDGSFLADACIVGGHRIHCGLIDIRPNRIGRRSFIGNSALVPAGVDIGNECLIGVMSRPPVGTRRAPNGSRWLGSPSFQLPRTQQDDCFGEEQTYRPNAGVVAARTLIDTLRILTPGLIATADLVAFCIAVVILDRMLLPSAVVAAAACVALLLSFATIMLVAAIKNLLIGQFAPTVRPLWCSFVWLNEVVNGVYETIAANAMAPLMGTPYAAYCLRRMGCKIGKWVFLETTLFSEFDLVEIGDHAALNRGCTIQTHLFEDRVMKADNLRIGEGCCVGNMAVVLYGSVMQPGSWLGPLSVLMKGETLPLSSRWQGIPTQPVHTP